MKQPSALGLSCLLVLAALRGSSGESANPFIIGGDLLVDTSSVPYHVGIVLEGSTSYICNGALIDDDWVLTSARCVSQGKNMTVALSATNYLSYVISPPSMAVGVDASMAFPHPDYNAATVSNDIGLIKLPVAFSKATKYLKMVKYNKDAKKTFKGTAGTTSGFGHDGTPGSSVVMTNLKKIDMNIMDNADCAKEFASVTTSLLCVASVDNKGPCYLDEGAPLVVTVNKQPLLVGVYPLSTHVIDCEATKVKIFTRVAPHDKWITKTISSNK